LLFFVEVMVKGCQAYKDSWAPVPGEEIPCQRDVGNQFDVYWYVKSRYVWHIRLVNCFVCAIAKFFRKWIQKSCTSKISHCTVRTEHAQILMMEDM